MSRETSKGYKPIADYGLIGDCRTAALVGLDSSIDWCCFPRFDAPSAFGAVLDHERGGRFALTPQDIHTSSQRYIGESNVLETRFVTASGVCTVTDCMPLYLDDQGHPIERHEVIRLVRCESGEVTLDVEYSPRPDYGRIPVTLETHGMAVVCRHGDQELTLQAPVPLEVTGEVAQGAVRLGSQGEAVFVLTYRDATTSTDTDGLSPTQRLERTTIFWERKAAELAYQGPWRAEVARSYLVLHLLTYIPSGGIVAAPTASLPEEIGGVRNWDYRYVWLRDAALTIDALLNLGHKEESISFFRWLARVCSLYGERLHIMCRVDSEEDLPEEELPHWEGYRRSAPVRIGNGAATQVQHDIYGEVLSAAHLLAESGEEINDDQWDLLRTLANLAMRRWRERDSGIWEMRSGPFHFVHSKVMCWVALDRAVSLAERTGRIDQETERWRQAAQEIKEEVLERGWSAEKQAFVQHYETDALDATGLLIPLMGFLPWDDPRVTSTVEAIQRELGRGPFLYRYRTEETDDGLSGGEGAFTLCSFWLAQALAGMGRNDEARRLFTELLGYANHLGLFSEMIDPHTGAALGNFPQAFTHIGLILAACACVKGA